MDTTYMAAVASSHHLCMGFLPSCVKKNLYTDGGETYTAHFFWRIPIRYPKQAST